MSTLHDQYAGTCPLATLRPGQSGIVVHLEGGCEFQSRIVSMGLNPGMEVEVLQNASGPVLVAIGETRLAIGHGMAEKIFVAADPE